MFAIILDKNNYLQEYSDRKRKPESILVNSIPDETDPEKLNCYQYIENKFVFDAEKWAAIEAIRADQKKAAERDREIRDLKEQLESTDYQIIKCYEYAMNDLDMPYDVAELHLARQALRDQINELEAAI